MERAGEAAYGQGETRTQAAVVLLLYGFWLRFVYFKLDCKLRGAMFQCWSMIRRSMISDGRNRVVSPSGPKELHYWRCYPSGGAKLYRGGTDFCTLEGAGKMKTNFLKEKGAL